MHSHTNAHREDKNEAPKHIKNVKDAENVALNDFYDILKISKNATKEDIKKNWRKFSIKWHPDKHSSDERAEAEAKIKDINIAYEWLYDESSRKLYDDARVAIQSAGQRGREHNRHTSSHHSRNEAQRRQDEVNEIASHFKDQEDVIRSLPADDFKNLQAGILSLKEKMDAKDLSAVSYEDFVEKAIRGRPIRFNFPDNFFSNPVVVPSASHTWRNGILIYVMNDSMKWRAVKYGYDEEGFSFFRWDQTNKSKTNGQIIPKNISLREDAKQWVKEIDLLEKEQLEKEQKIIGNVAGKVSALGILSKRPPLPSEMQHNSLQTFEYHLDKTEVIQLKLVFHPLNTTLTAALIKMLEKISSNNELGMVFDKTEHSIIVKSGFTQLDESTERVDLQVQCFYKDGSVAKDTARPVWKEEGEYFTEALNIKELTPVLDFLEKNKCITPDNCNQITEKFPSRAKTAAPRSS